MDGRFPTILQRTPYNKDRDVALAEFFVPRGYASNAPATDFTAKLVDVYPPNRD